jgi:hypothetical protein
MQSARGDIEKSVLISIFGDWTDNPFEVEDWKKAIIELDPELFRKKSYQLVVRAVKKLNADEKFKYSLPTLDEVRAYIEINAPKIYPYTEGAILEAFDKQPLCLNNFLHCVELLKQYKLKDEILNLD